MSFKPRNSNRILGLLFAFIFFLPTYALSKTVSLPLSIDYQLLRSLVVKAAFTGPGDTAVLLYEDAGCKKVTISEPTFTEQDLRVRFEVRVYVRAGVYLMGNCLMPVEWEGYLSLIQRPKINDKWVLSFDTLDSAVYDKDHAPAKIAGVVWDFVKTSVYEYLEGITVNLAPPVSDLKSFMGRLFPPHLEARAKRMMDSMRPGEVETNPGFIRVGILTEVQETYEKEKDQEEEVISKAEVERFIKTWEVWDSFLVYVITSLSKEPLSHADRQVLLSTLLETRYRFVTELSANAEKGDFVREQFISAWEQMAPVFRRHLADDPSRSLMSYLAFLTASDALSALDQIGPTLGIEISRNGLIRLARLLNEGKSVILAYRPGVDMKLREVLGLGPAPLPSAGALKRDKREIQAQKTEQGDIDGGLLSYTIKWLLSDSAWAKGNKPRDELEKIRKWVDLKEDLPLYLEQVKTLVIDASNHLIKKRKIAERYDGLYRLLALSTAWQESCFQQFVLKKGKVTYIRSYNGTSVGLMQVNERVWRGMYDQDSLRWDIYYNAAAGCDIIDLYFRRYALRKMKKGNPLKDDTLARVIYAMYNGGPAQYHKFLRRSRRGKYYLSDRLFFEKYTWARNGRWENISKCLSGL